MWSFLEPRKNSSNCSRDIHRDLHCPVLHQLTNTKNLAIVNHFFSMDVAQGATSTSTGVVIDFTFQINERSNLSLSLWCYSGFSLFEFSRIPTQNVKTGYSSRENCFGGRKKNSSNCCISKADEIGA